MVHPADPRMGQRSVKGITPIMMSELDLLNFVRWSTAASMNLLLVSSTEPAQSVCINFADLFSQTGVDLAE